MLIFLTGFMCSGKTTDGSIIAAKLNIPFLDLDNELEKQAGLSIKSYLETYGVDKFRSFESQILCDIHHSLKRLHFDIENSIPNPQAVIATGGGCILAKENRDFLLQNNHEVIWLDLPFNLLYNRIKLQMRPLLNGLSEAEIRKIYNERRPLYKAVCTHRISSLPITEQVLSLYI